MFAFETFEAVVIVAFAIALAIAVLQYRRSIRRAEATEKLLNRYRCIVQQHGRVTRLIALIEKMSNMPQRHDGFWPGVLADAYDELHDYHVTSSFSGMLAKNFLFEFEPAQDVTPAWYEAKLAQLRAIALELEHFNAYKWPDVVIEAYNELIRQSARSPDQAKNYVMAG